MGSTQFMMANQKPPLYEYQILSDEALSNDVLRLFVSPANIPIQYAAGQYIKILYPNGLFMPFSIANSPNKAGTLEFHIRCYQHDAATQLLIKEVKANKRLWLTGPYGHSYLHGQTNLTTLLLAAGTGFAPCKAILEDIFSQEISKLVHLYWGVRFEEDFYLPNLPIEWQKNHQNFLYTPVISKYSAKWQGKKGYVTPLVVEDYPDLSHFQVYLFGSMNMAVTAKELFLKHGLKRENLFSDML